MRVLPFLVCLFFCSVAYAKAVTAGSGKLISYNDKSFLIQTVQGEKRRLPLSFLRDEDRKKIEKLIGKTINFEGTYYP